MEYSPLRPDTINALRYGAEASFAMLAGMQLDVFTPLSSGPKTTEQIAKAIEVGPARLRLLLYALVAAGLLTEQEGRFSNTPEAQHFLVKEGSAYMGHMHQSLAAQWGFKLNTAESVRTGIPQARIDFSHASSEDLEAFLRRFNVSTIATAHELIERYDFSSTKTLVDVGGGGGGLAMTIAKAHPQIRATVIDLPQVTPIAQKIVEDEGMTDRVTVMEGDVVSGTVPGSYDVAILRALLHVLSPEDARRAVLNIGTAMNPGGTIFIVGQILDDSRTSPPDAVRFNVLAINQFDAGEAYTEHEHREWLSAAGFVDIDRANFLLTDGFGSGLITARKRE